LRNVLRAMNSGPGQGSIGRSINREDYSSECKARVEQLLTFVLTMSRLFRAPLWSPSLPARRG
jgi:hypothetical protein